jgi:pyrroline-5-carboxylate reductase
MKIAFIGGGNMGEAMLAAVLNNLPAPHNISVSDISDSRRARIEQKYGGGCGATSLTTTSRNLDAIAGKDVIILAVKPQNLPELLAELKGKIGSSQLVLSIIAGVTIAAIAKGLNHQAVARAMPNTPAQIGEGMSVWTATDAVTEKQKKAAGDILGAMGKEIYVSDEADIDRATAVSGSGPAYFFLMVEALVEAAVAIGLPADMAQKLVLQTMLGSGRFIEASGESPAELRKKVTSPGGTTAAALEQFDRGDFSALVKKAVAAAYARARELGK